MRESQIFWPLVALGIIFLFDAIFSPGFFKIGILDGHLFGNLIDVLNDGAPLMLVAIGMTMVIATKGVDLSVGAVMAIYFSVDSDPDIWAAMHRIATYPHKAWIEALAAQGDLQPWVDPERLIDDLGAFSSLVLLDWCRGGIDVETSIRRKLLGALAMIAGSTRGEAQLAVSARLEQIALHGVPDYAPTYPA